jgi:two-component system, NarL family, response regulator
MIRLLIIESREILRAAMAAVFAQQTEMELIGFVSDSKEAEQQVIAALPQIVLATDTSDFEFAKMAKANGAKVIVYTHSFSDEDILNALEAGVAAYVLQRTSVNLLVAAIHAVAHGATWLDPIVGRKAIALMSQKNAPSARRTNRVMPQGDLSVREVEVLELLAKGMPNKEIGDSLLISSDTVKSHVRRIMEKLRVKTRTEAAIRAIKLGLVDTAAC